MSSLLALASPGWIRGSRLSSEPSVMPSVTLSVSNTWPGAVWGEGPTWLFPSPLDSLPILSDSPSWKMCINRKAKGQERDLGRGRDMSSKVSSRHQRTLLGTREGKICTMWGPRKSQGDAVTGKKWSNFSPPLAPCPAPVTFTLS